MTERTPIRLRDRDTIVQALAAGVVPRVGLQHIQVGRMLEVGALIKDIDRIADGGSSCRFVIGEYGAGKTFFLSLVRLIALERRCVTIHADLAPDRRIHATGGQARGLYAEAIRNMATRTKPDGGALPSVVERFISECVKVAHADNRPVEQIIDDRLASIQELVGGHDFAHVLKCYWRGSEDGNEVLKASALRWLRAEFPTKTEARQALGVRSIIDDADVFDSLKLLARFTRLAGYSGFAMRIVAGIDRYLVDKLPQRVLARHQVKLPGARIRILASKNIRQCPSEHGFRSHKRSCAGRVVERRNLGSAIGVGSGRRGKLGHQTLLCSDRPTRSPSPPPAG